MTLPIDDSLTQYFETQIDICGDRLPVSESLFTDFRNLSEAGKLDLRATVIALSNAFVTLEGRVASLEVVTREES